MREGLELCNATFAENFLRKKTQQLLSIKRRKERKMCEETKEELICENSKCDYFGLDVRKVRGYGDLPKSIGDYCPNCGKKTLATRISSSGARVKKSA